jgi:hypothetical protein
LSFSSLPVSTIMRRLEFSGVETIAMLIHLLSFFTLSPPTTTGHLLRKTGNWVFCDFIINGLRKKQKSPVILFRQDNRAYFA